MAVEGGLHLGGRYRPDPVGEGVDVVGWQAAGLRGHPGVQPPAGIVHVGGVGARHEALEKAQPIFGDAVLAQAAVEAQHELEGGHRSLDGGEHPPPHGARATAAGEAHVGAVGQPALGAHLVHQRGGHPSAAEAGERERERDAVRVRRGQGGVPEHDLGLLAIGLVHELQAPALVGRGGGQLGRLGGWPGRQLGEAGLQPGGEVLQRDAAGRGEDQVAGRRRCGCAGGGCRRGGRASRLLAVPSGERP